VRGGRKKRGGRSLRRGRGGGGSRESTLCLKLQSLYGVRKRKKGAEDPVASEREEIKPGPIKLTFSAFGERKEKENESSVRKARIIKEGEKNSDCLF